MAVTISVGISVWMPSLLIEKGFSMSKSYSFTMLQQAASIIGSCITGGVSDRIGRRRNVIISYIATFLAVVLLGSVSGDFALLGCIMLLGFCMAYGMTATQPLYTESYPTECRSTGIAWVHAMGRLGAFGSALIAGAILQAGFGFTGVLVLFAVPAVVNVILMLTFKTEAKGKSLEASSSEVGICACR
jgi:putative MFS transporter